MKVVGVIPARYAASRFPGKLLAELAGRPVLSHVIEVAKKIPSVSQVVVAADHEETFQLAQSHGVVAKMTDPELPSGTDRVRAGLEGIEYDIAVNIQGDEPLLDPLAVDRLIQSMISAKTDAGTLASPISAEDLVNPNRVKVLIDHKSLAIYFSRLPIPHSRSVDFSSGEAPLAYQHIGLYAYSRETLEAFCQQPPCALEMAEGLEQLRLLWMGRKMAVSLVDHVSPGVDTPEDLAEIEGILKTGATHGV